MHFTLDTFSIGNYRSLQDVWLPLSTLSVVTGANGSGKSNVFRALALLKAAARGTFAEALAGEGGMPGVLFAGAAEQNRSYAKQIARIGKDENVEIQGGPSKTRVELRLGLAFSDLRYELIAGLPKKDIFDELGLFMRDPDIKSELIWSGKRRPTGMLTQRKNRQLWAGELHYEQALDNTQSAMAQAVDASRFPDLAALRARIDHIRLYQEFRCDAASRLRAPQVGYRAPILADDGSNLCAALGTILMGDHSDAFRAAVESAFPEAALDIDCDERGVFHLQFRQRGLLRSLSAAELSDGTLRYLCLLCALFSSQPATLLAFNEPEASLHPNLLTPLARQLANASRNGQVLVITHSEQLANALEDFSDASPVQLSRSLGMTRIEGQSVLNTPTF